MGKPMTPTKAEKDEAKKITDLHYTRYYTSCLADEVRPALEASIATALAAARAGGGVVRVIDKAFISTWRDPAIGELPPGQSLAIIETPPPQPATEPVKVGPCAVCLECPCVCKPATEGVGIGPDQALKALRLFAIDASYGQDSPTYKTQSAAWDLIDAFIDQHRGCRSPTAQRGPGDGEGVYKREAMAWRRYMQHAREHELIVFRVRSQHATDEQRQPFDTLTELELKLMEAQDAVDALAAEKGDKT